MGLEIILRWYGTSANGGHQSQYEQVSTQLNFDAVTNAVTATSSQPPYQFSNQLFLLSILLLKVIWSYPEQGYNSATRHFVWLVGLSVTVYHWTFVRHLHYQCSKTCSSHIFSHVLTSQTNCFQSTNSEHCTAPLHRL